MFHALYTSNNPRNPSLSFSIFGPKCPNYKCDRICPLSAVYSIWAPSHLLRPAIATCLLLSPGCLFALDYLVTYVKMPDKLPPRVQDGVLAVTASSDIDAPVDKVWEVLLDFASYPEWYVYFRAYKAPLHA